MKRHALRLIGCGVFVALGVPMIVFGTGETRLIGAMSVLFFGGGGLALLLPLLSRGGGAAVRIVDVGAERGFLFGLGRAKRVVVIVAAAGVTAASGLLIAYGYMIVGAAGAVVFGAFMLYAVLTMGREHGLAMTPTRVVVPGAGGGELAWDAVAGVGFVEHARALYIGIDATDETLVRRTRTAVARAREPRARAGRPAGSRGPPRGHARTRARDADRVPRGPGAAPRDRDRGRARAPGLMRGFAELPARIEALAREHERLAVVLLDAFGMAFVRRHADHPLLQRLEIEPLASQFPSTTTAHLTTLYTGLPVEEHGLYEWRTYEPLVGDVIRPLLWAPARDDDPPLTIDPRDVLPPARFFERVPGLVLQPQAITGSKYGSVALAGRAGGRLRDDRGGRRAAGRRRPGLTFLYWDRIDAVGHKHGPSSAAFDHTARRALDALEQVDTPLLVTADHGQIDVDVTDALDVLWPPLLEHLKLHPAGSARDLFLHVDDPDTVVAELGERLGDRARVCLAAELFPTRRPAAARAARGRLRPPRAGAHGRPAGLRQLRARLQGPPRRPHARGVRDLDRHQML